MKKKFTPLLLSACVLPGLGQIQLGKTLKGIFFAVISIFLCLIPLAYFFKSFWKLSQIPPATRSLLLETTIKNLWIGFIENEKVILISLLLLLALWAWNVWDVWRESDER